jgi:hypothetical protein
VLNLLLQRCRHPVHLGCLAANVQRGSIVALRRFWVSVAVVDVVWVHAPRIAAGKATVAGAEAVAAEKKGPDETLSASVGAVTFVVPVA